MLRTLLVAASAAAVLAACPNNCKGHGKCHTNDVCECFPNWRGADCSQQVCPFGNSWALDSSKPHDYEECSGQGVCDRSSGLCKCNPPFTGSACQRLSCPNDCSGRGRCVLLSDVEATVAYSAESWDATKIQACQCDPGAFGHDCSLSRCPSGDDPLTVCKATVKGQAQELRVALGSRLNADPNALGMPSYPASDEGMSVFGTTDARTLATVLADVSTGQMAVGYTDVYGDVYPGPAAAKAVFSKAGANTADAGKDSIEVALETIPGKKVADVKVRKEWDQTLTDTLSKRYVVEFVPDVERAENVGLQGPLTCDLRACAHAGCAPVVNPAFLYRYAATSPERPPFDDPMFAAGTTFDFHTGLYNSDADFAAGGFLRLAPGAAPALPLGVAVDTGASASSPLRADMRIVVAVQDPPNPTQDDDSTDVWWVKVTYGNTNISTDGFEYDGSAVGPWSAARSAGFQGSLLGFKYQGRIPAGLEATLPDHAGVSIQFPRTNLVATNEYFRFFEILVKLPSCKVTPLVTGSEFVDVDGSAIAPVDANVENVECGNRGQCNRDIGKCECFSGYGGLSCSVLTTVV